MEKPVRQMVKESRRMVKKQDKLTASSFGNIWKLDWVGSPVALCKTLLRKCFFLCMNRMIMLSDHFGWSVEKCGKRVSFIPKRISAPVIFFEHVKRIVHGCLWGRFKSWVIINLENQVSSKDFWSLDDVCWLVDLWRFEVRISEGWMLFGGLKVFGGWRVKDVWRFKVVWRMEGVRFLEFGGWRMFGVWRFEV